MYDVKFYVRTKVNYLFVLIFLKAIDKKPKKWYTL